MKLEVRTAGPEDAAAVERVLKSSYPALMAPAYEAEILARALPLMTRPNARLLAAGTFYLCEAGEEAVGCGGWSREPPGGGAIEPGLAHIRHFAVRAGWTGRGVGRALYARCEQDARAAGVRTFEAWSSLNGEAFYRALGFARQGEIDVPMGPGVALPSIRMRRAIPPRNGEGFGALDCPRQSKIVSGGHDLAPKHAKPQAQHGGGASQDS